MRELMNLIAKLTLSNALSTRILRSVVIQCIKVSSTSVWVTSHKQAKETHNKAQSETKASGASQEQFKEQCGMPSVWGVNAWVQVYARRLETRLSALQAQEELSKTAQEEKDHIAKEAMILKESIDSWKANGGWKLIHQELPHFAQSQRCSMPKRNVCKSVARPKPPSSGATPI